LHGREKNDNVGPNGAHDMSNPTPTARLYYDDSYLTHFEADVVERAQGGLRVYLDRTAFYPTSGGQPFDTGWLAAAGAGSADNVEVIDVVDEGERIAHVLAAPSWARKSKGTCISRAVSITCSSTPASTCCRPYFRS
jgi:alanyl-tRNA synthetase